MKAIASKKYRTIINEGKHLEPPKVRAIPLSLRVLKAGFRWLSPLFPKFASEKAYQVFTTPFVRARHFQQDELLGQAVVSDFLFGKHLLKKYSWGAGEKTVLLAHGWQSRGTALRSFVPGLVEQGFSVVAFDGPGHGDSPGKRVNLPIFSGIIANLLKNHAPVHAIIGHSFGGGSALFTMLGEKENLHLPKLVLVASPVNLCWVVNNFLEQVGASTQTQVHFRNKISKKMGLPFEMGNAIEYFDQLPIGEVLLIHDRQDQSVPFQLSEKLFRAFDSIELVATEGMGHFKLMKHPKVISTVIDFLSTKV